MEGMVAKRCREVKWPPNAIQAPCHPSRIMVQYAHRNGSTSKHTTMKSDIWR